MLSDNESEGQEDQIRNIISETFIRDVMVGPFIVIAEVLDDDGEATILTWHNGGTIWTKFGMLKWAKKYFESIADSAERIEEEEDDE